MNRVKKIDWDSTFFGYAIGKIDLSKDNVFSELDIEQSKFDLIYVFSDQIIPTLQDKLVDQKVTFELLLENSNEINKINIYPFNSVKYSKKQLEQLVIESGVFSRFKLDLNFKNNEFEKLYLEWLKQSVNGNYALELFVAKNKETLSGFITIQKVSEEIATIGLIAVNKSCRGEGIAKELIIKAINYCKENKFTTLEVATQKENIPAMNLYNKLGFREKKIKYIYHIWNK